MANSKFSGSGFTAGNNATVGSVIAGYEDLGGGNLVNRRWTLTELATGMWATSNPSLVPTLDQVLESGSIASVTNSEIRIRTSAANGQAKLEATGSGGQVNLTASNTGGDISLTCADRMNFSAGQFWFGGSTTYNFQNDFNIDLYNYGGTDFRVIALGNAGIYTGNPGSQTGGGDITLQARSGDVYLKTVSGTLGTGELKVQLAGVTPQQGQILRAKDTTGSLEWTTPSGGVSSFTNLTAGDVVQWDYAVDGPNIELITVQDPNPAITQDNVITMYSGGVVSDISDIPDGATGTLIVHPTANPYFNFPTGSKLSDASNIRLDGATKVLRWVKEGDGADPSLSPTAPGYGCLYWAGFENFASAAVIPGPDIEPAITSNLYGWWDPADYTGSVLGNTNDPATGNPYLGVVNNSTIPSKSLGGSSTGNSLTVSNSETVSDEAWEHIQLRDPAEGAASDDYKAFFLTGDGGYFFNNSTVNPSGGRFTVMVWFKVDTSQADVTDLGLFDASISSGSSDPSDQGLALDDINSNTNRRAYFATRPNSEDWESKFQKWEDDKWTCIIISADPTADDGAGGTKAAMRHLIANQYTVDNATNTITGSGIVSDGDSIAINADGTYIDWLYHNGNTAQPSDEAQLPGPGISPELDANDLSQTFTGFEFARQAAGWITSFDFNGRIGLMALWDGEAKSDTDMQTLFDYSKTQFGIS